MSLRALMNTKLPMNRKERFFTGTVFPMIVCRDDFKHVGRFLSLVDGYDPQPLDVTPEHTNIQFFTEYGLKESIFGASKLRFPTEPESRDTPDIIMLITGDRTVLIALEAKMFLKPNRTALYTQMAGQQYALNSVRESLGVDEMYLAALVPKQWHDALGDDFAFPVITWNKLYDEYKPLFPDDYFLEMLKIALDNFPNLVSIYSANSEGSMIGDLIYEQFIGGSLDMIIMGRSGGLDGELLKDDLASGRWKEQLYQVSPVETPPNKNWFSIAKFVEQIDKSSEV